jgi:uncharacterized protein (DUF302 family)
VKVDGLITVRSSFEHGETLARFEAAVQANGMSVVSPIDQASGALEVSVSLDATTLLMFGNRARQVELVKALRLIALELPFKVLIWQDATGETCFRTPIFGGLRRAMEPRATMCVCSATVAVMIDGIVRKAGSPP